MGDSKHQIGFVAESTYGTPVVVNRFVEFTSENLELRNNIAGSSGIRTGRRYGGAARRISRKDAGGSFTMEVSRQTIGLLFHHLLGAVNTVNPVGSVYEHTFSPGTLLGKSLTVQKGVHKPDGTVQAFTYPGSKILSADFSVDQDGLLMATWEIDAREERTNIALAAASYTGPVVFTYSEGALKVDGVTKANVKKLNSLKIGNSLDTSRFFLGNQGLKDQPINHPFDTLGGSIDAEFQNLTDFYDLFAADTEIILVVEFVGGVISGGHNYTLRFTINNCRIEGETPKISAPEMVVQNIPFVGLDDASLSAIEIFYKTSDATP